MKRKTGLLLLVMVCLIAFPVSAQEWAPEGVDIGGARTPVPAPEGLYISDVYPELQSTLPEGYYLNDAEYDGQAFMLVYRDSGSGGFEILFSVVQEEEDPHGLQYIDGSYEQSGGRFLYFTLTNGKNLHRSLYSFDMREERTNLVLGEPCSNLMLFPDAPEDISGLGWILYGDYILPVRLADASSYERMAASVEMLGGLPESSGSFFYGTENDRERKYAYLIPEGNSVLRITVVTLDPENPDTERDTVYLYDCLSGIIEHD